MSGKGGCALTLANIVLTISLIGALAFFAFLLFFHDTNFAGLRLVMVMLGDMVWSIRGQVKCAITASLVSF